MKEQNGTLKVGRMKGGNLSSDLPHIPYTRRNGGCHAVYWNCSSVPSGNSCADCPCSPGFATCGNAARRFRETLLLLWFFNELH